MPIAATATDYQLAFELAPIGLVLSRHRIMLDCNAAVCEMFGASREQLIGQSFRLLYPSADEYERIGERLVPIHSALREMGFISFVEARRAAGGRKLFPELQASSTGYFSDPFSKWFRRFLAKADAARPKTCFHSFRHCYRDALREARIDHEIALALGGWASGSGKDGSETAAAYGRGYRMETLKVAIEKVAYPGLDLGHLVATPANA